MYTRHPYGWGRELSQGRCQVMSVPVIRAFCPVACNAPHPSLDQQVMPVTEDFIKALLADAEFQRKVEEEDQRKWETFALRLLAWDGESEELPSVVDFESHLRGSGFSHL